MIVLNQKEREGLNDVFSSIQSTKNRYAKIQNILTFMILANTLVASLYLHRIFIAN